MDTPTPTQRAVIAEKCCIAEQYLYQILTGRKVPSPELSLSIERATGGAITRQDLRPDDFWRIWPDLEHLAPVGQ